MLVNWRYPVPASGSGSKALDFYAASSLPLHIRPYYGSNVGGNIFKLLFIHHH